MFKRLNEESCKNCGANYWVRGSNGDRRCKPCGHSEKIELKNTKQKFTLEQYKIYKNIQMSLHSEMYEDDQEPLLLTDEVTEITEVTHKKSYSTVKLEKTGDFMLKCTNEECTSTARVINLAKLRGISKELLGQGCAVCGNRNLQLCPR